MVTALSDSSFESKSPNQRQAEGHPGPGTAMDMGTTIPAVSNMALERYQLFAGARGTVIKGGTFATVAGNMIINPTEGAGTQVSAANDDEDASGADSGGDSSLQNSPLSGGGLGTGEAVPASPEAEWAETTCTAVSAAASMEWDTEETEDGVSDEDTIDRGEILPLDWQLNADVLDEDTNWQLDDVLDEDTVDRGEILPRDSQLDTYNKHPRFFFRW
jgi:hypothetical protein